MPVEELAHPPIEFGTPEAAVTGAGHLLQQRRHARLLQGRVNFLGLRVRHNRIAGAVHGQEGRIACRNMRHRRSLTRRRLAFRHRPAQQQRLRVIPPLTAVDRAGLARQGQEILRTEVVHHAGDPAVLIRMGAEAALQLRHIRAGAEQGHQMPARRTAPDADPRWIEPPFGRMRLEPADRRLAVVNLRRPDGLIGEPVAHGDAGVVAGGDPIGDVREPARLVTGAPAAAMHEDDHRQRLARGALSGQVEVELLPRVVRAGVGQIKTRLNALRQWRPPARLDSPRPPQAFQSRRVFGAGDVAVPVRVESPKVGPRAFRQLVAGEPAVAVAIGPLKQPRRFRRRRLLARQDVGKDKTEWQQLAQVHGPDCNPHAAAKLHPTPPAPSRRAWSPGSPSCEDPRQTHGSVPPAVRPAPCGR